MNDQQLLSLVGQGAGWVVLVAALYKILSTVGAGLIEELKGMRRDLSEHTKLDLAAQADVREDLAALNASMRTALDMRQAKQRAQTQPQVTNLRAVPSGSDD